MRLRYRNTGFCLQWFIFYGKYYRGLEIGKWYVRYYRKTLEGVYPKYKELK